MAGELLAWLIVAMIGIGLSALFSGMEIGLYTLNRVRLTVRASHGDIRAQRLRAMLSRPNRMLSTILIGNNAANYAGSFGIAAILDLYGVATISAILINVAIVVSVLFVFGETLPKDLFRTYTDHWSYAMSGFVTWCERVVTWSGLGPIVERAGALTARLVGTPADEAGTIPGVARQRISHLIKEGIAVGLLSESQTTLADRALAMRERSVSSEMVPWPSVVALDVDAPPQQRTALIRRHPFSRFPVVERTTGPRTGPRTDPRNGAERFRVVGLISMLDVLLEPDKPTRELLRPTIEVKPQTPLHAALSRMREQGCAMSIVTRKHDKRPLGIVTVKNLIEPLTGELSAW